MENTGKAITAYKDERCEFGKDEKGDVYFIYDGIRYDLTSSPHEPCMYIKSDGKQIILHNSFDVYDLPEFFQSHKKLESITGRKWDVKSFCALLLEVIVSGRTELDISEAEDLVSFDYDAEYPYNILCRLIQSDEVAEAMIERQQEFSPEEIAAYVYHCSGSFEQMKELFSMCEGTPAEKAADELRKRTESQLEMIKRQDDGCVFELRIRDAGDITHYDSYLCESYDAALHTIDEYTENYREVIDKPQYYTIRKRRVYGGGGFSENIVGEIDLLPDKQIHSIWLPVNIYEGYPNLDCFLLPNVFRRKDIIKVVGETVQYYFCMDSETEGLHFGVFCLPLDTPAFRNDDFVNVDVHEHIPLFMAQRAKYSELEPDLQIIYERLRAFLADEESGECVRSTFRVTVRDGYMHIMKKALDVLCAEFSAPIPKIQTWKDSKGKIFHSAEGFFTLSPDDVTKDYLMNLLWNISRGIGHSMNFADGTKEFMLGEPGGNYYIVISCNPVMK